jgi:hypothetical protein
MAIVRTISVVKGKGSVAHNNRDFVAENVIEERIEDDITYKKESLEDAYEHLFGDAIREYNERQKRADRKIDGVKGYMDKLKTSKNGEKLFYENVIQVGNMHDCKVGSPEGEKAKEILDKYMRDFQERNPNLYVFNAVMHLDEQTPHLHIDYIPIAHGYKQGLQARNSLDKALGEQGIEGKSNKYENRTNKWQEKEKNCIAEIMHEYGFERAEEKGIKAPKLSVGAYKAAVGEIENQLQQLPNHIESKSIPFSKERVSVSVADLELLERSAKLVETHENALQEVYSAEREKLTDLAVLQNQTREALQSAQADKEKYSALKTEQEDLNKLYQDVLSENINLKARVTRSEAHLEAEIEKATKPLLEEIKTLKTENNKLLGICQKLKALVDKIKPRRQFKKPFVNLFNDERFTLRDKGLLIALYKDGTERKVGTNENGGFDNKTLADERAGLCTVGYWAEEKSVNVPEHIYKELVSRQDKTIAPSQDLKTFIDNSLSKPTPSRNRGIER